MEVKTAIFQIVLIILGAIFVFGDVLDLEWQDIDDVGDRGDTHARDSYIEKIHNAVRKNVKVPASNMEVLRWDINLTRVAEDAANECWGPDKNPTPADIGLNRIGINFFVTAPDNKETPGKQAFLQWTRGMDSYDYENNSCSGDCSEYLEIITATTQDMGCGVSECANGTVVLCLYKRGMKSTDGKPYKAGDWCSECVETEGFCRFGRLCAGHMDFIPTTPDPEPKPEPGQDPDGLDDKDNGKEKSEKTSRYGLPLWCIILICIIALLLIITICAVIVHSIRSRDTA